MAIPTRRPRPPRGGIVVGSRWHGRSFGALLGSVSQYLAAHAACPVVAIKPLANQHGRRSRAGR